MRLTVLVPSQEYKSWAGARIRYHRLAPDLARLGIELALDDINQFDPLTAECDWVLISKCHDPKSLVVAAIMRDRGKAVGIDLFDDYFSEAMDSRLLRYRNWLRDIIQACEFALCSTEAMADVVGQYRRDLPSHVLNDPAPEHNRDELGLLVEKKRRDARDRGLLKVVWFGIGDNAFFPVGLADLSAFGSTLGELRQTGMSVELKVVTNARALDADGLSLIKALPVATSIVEWSEEAESQALHEALLAFLPVNSQGFSAAKSLNRAVTALSAGCQVLSVGFPLYEALEDVIYRDAESFANDLAAGSLRLSSEGLARYGDRMDALASAGREAHRLADFLSIARRDISPPPEPLPLCVVHGHSTRADAHELVQRIGGFSVASPFCAAPLDFDVVFRVGPLGLDMLVSPMAARRLVDGHGVDLKAGEEIGGREYRLVRRGGDESAATSADGQQTPLPYMFATYRSTMTQIKEMMAQVFGPVRTIVSETSRLPFAS